MVNLWIYEDKSIFLDRASLPLLFSVVLYCNEYDCDVFSAYNVWIAGRFNFATKGFSRINKKTGA
jgi:hypothetical protein